MNDLEELYHSGQLNLYFYKQLSSNFNYLPDDLKQTYLDEAISMSKLGVSSQTDQKEFFYILLHVPDIIKEIAEVTKNSPEVSAKVSAVVFTNRKQRPINTLMGFFFAVARAAEEIGLKLRKNIEDRLNKKAYPQDMMGTPMYQPYDLNKWMRATRDIYSRAQAGETYENAWNSVTEQWNKMEQLDFKHWLRFYQEGAHNKYKIAAHYYVSDNGFYVPNPIGHEELKAKLPEPAREKEESNKDVQKAEDKNDVRDKIESQRSKIISRLNAAEKLLSSMDGQFFAGDDQEFMLKLLQDLKRKVQTANKITVKSSLFEDYIWRAGNYCKAYGKTKSASFFYKIAQVTPEDPAALLLGEQPAGEEPSSALTEEPMTEAPVGSGAEQETIEAIKEFFDRLTNGIRDLGDDEELEAKNADWNAAIVVEAQEEPLAQQPEAAVALPQEENLEVELPEEAAPRQQQKADPQGNDVEQIIDSALSNITVNDVIAKLDMLAGMFKKREISKQIAIVDMMLDKLGLSAFFPTLGEALRSSLESSGYASTRIEEILNKLRSSVTDTSVSTTELTSPEQPSPEVLGIAEKLKAQQQEEDARKERRKQKEDAKQAPQLQPAQPAEEVPPELAQPAEVEPAPPAPLPR